MNRGFDLSSAREKEALAEALVGDKAGPEKDDDLAQATKHAGRKNTLPATSRLSFHPLLAWFCSKHGFEFSTSSYQANPYSANFIRVSLVARTRTWPPRPGSTGPSSRTPGRGPPRGAEGRCPLRGWRNTVGNLNEFCLVQKSRSRA
jgi:hypothetical protein